MLLVDTVKGKVIDDNELKEGYAKMQPYGEWLDSHLVQLKDIKIPNERPEEYTPEQRARLQKAFGYTYEQYRTSIRNMALNGAESIGAMGVDTPLAVFSKQNRPLFDYFKQLFAQVTNPPIDAIREEIVTSTSVYVGKDGNLLEQKPENCQVLKINNPILTNTDMMKIKSFKHEGFKTAVVSTLYYKSTKLERAIDRLFVEVDKAFREGANILVLSDRGVDENHMPIPSLLAVSAVHQHLVKTKKSTSLAIILESGEPREVHHFATLLGYGASAINPYLALETIHELIDSHMLEKDYYAAVDDYNHAVISGIVKIASKMGISTIQSYQGSQIFEAIGISSDVIEKYFTGTVSRVGGITLEDIEENVEKLHSEAFDPLGLPTDLTLDSVGAHKMRSQGEEHRYNPQTIHLLQQSTWTGSYDLFKQYTDLVDKENHGNLRGLLDFKFAETPVPLEEVESVDDIVKRFKTGAMSYGSISQEAHETLAIAMNHLHGKSNTGEGGAKAICRYIKKKFEDSVSFLYQDEIVAFFDLTRLGKSQEEVAGKLVYFIRDTYLKAGYSRVMTGHMNLRRQYVQAKTALDVGSRKKPYLWIHYFGQVALTYILEQATRRLPGTMICHEGLLELKKHDEENQTQYMETLRVYLEQHLSATQAARELFIHRSTFLYRLDRIKEILQSELDDPEEIFYLELSFRLLEQEQEKE